MAESCTVDGCAKEARRKSMCSMHVARLARHGTTDAPETALQRYERLVLRSESGCWGWSGSVNSSGYGRIGRLYVHRLSYELHCGPIPRGMLVMHSCDNPPCTNPAHLSVGSYADNRHDAASKGRLNGRGISPKPRRLSSKQLVEIHAMRSHGSSRAEIARRFGISVQHVSNIAPLRTRRV